MSVAHTALAEKSCTPCKAGTPPLDAETQKQLLAELNSWEIVDAHHLHRTLKFPDFVSALAFVNEVGKVAEAEGHHPNIFLTWGEVSIDIWTHSIDSLSESDFVLAAKIDAVCITE